MKLTILKNKDFQRQVCKYGMFATTIITPFITAYETTKYNDEKIRVVDNVEKAKLLAKTYKGTAMATTLNIILMINVDSMWSNKYNALMGSYLLLNEKFRKYREAVKELYDEKEIIRQTMRVGKNIPNTPTDKDKIVFYDTLTEQYFESTMLDVFENMLKINRSFAFDGYLTVDDYCKTFGFINRHPDELYGWSLDEGTTWLDIDIFKETINDDLDVLVLYNKNHPIELKF